MASQLIIVKRILGTANCVDVKLLRLVARLTFNDAIDHAVGLDYSNSEAVSMHCQFSELKGYL